MVSTEKSTLLQEGSKVKKTNLLDSKSPNVEKNQLEHRYSLGLKSLDFLIFAQCISKVFPFLVSLEGKYCRYLITFLQFPYYESFNRVYWTWFVLSFTIFILLIKKYYLNEEKKLKRYLFFQYGFLVTLELLTWRALRAYDLHLKRFNRIVDLEYLRSNWSFSYQLVLMKLITGKIVYLTNTVVLTIYAQTLVSALCTWYKELYQMPPYALKHQIDTRKNYLEVFTRLLVYSFWTFFKPYHSYKMFSGLPSKGGPYSPFIYLGIHTLIFYLTLIVANIRSRIEVPTYKLSEKARNQDILKQIFSNLIVMFKGLTLILLYPFLNSEKKKSSRTWITYATYVVLMYFHAYYYFLVLNSLERSNVRTSSTHSVLDQINLYLTNLQPLLIAGIALSFFLKFANSLIDLIKDEKKKSNAKIMWSFLISVSCIFCWIVTLFCYKLQIMNYAIVIVVFDVVNSNIRMLYYKSFVRHPLTAESKYLLDYMEPVTDLTSESIPFVFGMLSASTAINCGLVMLSGWIGLMCFYFYLNRDLYYDVNAQLL